MSLASSVRAIKHEYAHFSISWEDRVIELVKAGEDMPLAKTRIHVPIRLDDGKNYHTPRRQLDSWTCGR